MQFVKRDIGHFIMPKQSFALAFERSRGIQQMAQQTAEMFIEEIIRSQNKGHNNHHHRCLIYSRSLASLYHDRPRSLGRFGIHRHY